MKHLVESIFDLTGARPNAVYGGLVRVAGYSSDRRPPEEVLMMEKALHYGADAVFFEAPLEGKPPVAQAFVYASATNSPEEFAILHKQLWSWGGVPLIYRQAYGVLQLFRCAHRPDFESNGETVFSPFKTLKTATAIANDPWWEVERLRNGTLWDDPEVCRQLLSSKLSAQKTLIGAVRELHADLERSAVLTKALRRRLLILSILIAYLEARKVFEDEFFSNFLPNAQRFFQVLANGRALVALLESLEERFNGQVFALSAAERDTLLSTKDLSRFATLVEGRQERGGQRTLWQRYSFADLPVELISHIYQLFVKDTAVAVYTPHFVVRLMLGEVLTWERLDRLEANNEAILDGACGSGIFLVEAFKRLVLHWRHRNEWKKPNQTVLKKLLVNRLRGVDLEDGAVELATFSLCLGLCDALEPMEIRASVKLFPPLKGRTLHTGCFFAARMDQLAGEKIGVVVGNPPFTSVIRDGSEKAAYTRYCQNHGTLPDKQLAYLFLHESMEILAPGGVLSMVQQYNFLYNQKSKGFRTRFFEQWDVREVLDFISVRGLFQKGGADTKVVVVVAEAKAPAPNRKILHATFRRSGRADAEQGFDLDYYDMHWIPRSVALKNDAIWRADSVGGGRVLPFIDRLKRLGTLGKFAKERDWDFGEGWIEARKGKRVAADHITGKPFLPSTALTAKGVNEGEIVRCDVRLFKSYYTKKRFTPPMLLVRSQSDFHHAVWEKNYLTYTQRIIGFCAPPPEAPELHKIARWLRVNKRALQAFVAATSPRIFTQKSSALSKDDICSLPYDPSGNFKLTPHEEIVAEDITRFFRDLIRRGEKSAPMVQPASAGLDAFNETFTDRLNAVYRNKLRPLPAKEWPGVVCQPFVFGRGAIEWKDSDQLKDKIDGLLKERRGGGLHITRIARIYDGPCIYLIKPNRLRYWLRSVALRDADEALADLAEQGF